MEGFVDDDYDPLAPMHVGPEPEDTVDDDATAYEDPDHVVRLWLSDGQLSKVRISPVWHHKVGHRTLDDCFAAALAASRVRVAPAPTQQEPDLTGVDFSGLPRFGRSAFHTFQLALANFQTRWRDAVDRQRATPVQHPRPVRVEDDGVTVALDAQGWAVAVEFDEEWLEDRSVGEIATAVLSTARRAYAAHQPVASEPDELAELAREHEILMQGFVRVLTGRGQR